jgi:hypothetical protein
MASENKGPTLVCRKCGGGHLTIKCGKTPVVKEPEIIESKIQENKQQNNKIPKKITKIKISDLPKDATYNEIFNQLLEWGHIERLVIKNYNDMAVAYIEFGYEEEAKYFKEALDSTPYEYKIIHVDIIE